MITDISCSCLTVWDDAVQLNRSTFSSRGNKIKKKEEKKAHNPPTPLSKKKRVFYFPPFPNLSK